MTGRRGRIVSYGKQAVGRLLCNSVTGQLIAHVYGDAIPVGWGVIRTDHPAVSPTAKARIRFGFFERAECRFVRRWLRPHLDVIELGAGIGVVSSLIADRLRPDRLLLALEANPDLLGLLGANLSSVRTKPHVRVQHGAIAADPSQWGRSVRLRTTADHVGSRTVDAEGSPGVTVPATSLATLLGELTTSEFQLVADIEGAEAGPILFEDEVWARCAVAIVEFHETASSGRLYTADELRNELVTRHRFRVVAQRGAVAVLEH